MQTRIFYLPWVVYLDKLQSFPWANFDSLGEQNAECETRLVLLSPEVVSDCHHQKGERPPVMRTEWRHKTTRPPSFHHTFLPIFGHKKHTLS